MEYSTTISNPAEASKSKPAEDNFYTPANQSFYASNPYIDLDSSKQQIRLLEILHVNDDEPLQLKLLASFSLSSDELPKYCAISYFAGSHEETEVVYVNGIRFNAFANLARALRQVARARERGDLANHPPLIWADQICINQSSPVERSHQVGFMHKIYESAQIVLASLGWTDPSGGRWVKAAKRLDLEETSGLELKGGVIYIKGEIFAKFYDQDFKEDWSAFRHVLNSQWWQRGWVYQEIVSAQNIIVLFGNNILDWDVIAIAAQVFHEVSSHFIRCWVQNGEPSFIDRESSFKIVSDLDSNFASFMIESRMEWKDLRKKEAIELLHHAQHCSFTNPRDRIYAFVGLTDPGYRIIPNYQIDISGALRLACKRIILYTRRLDVLCYSIPGTNRLVYQRRGDIPSWTPDWTSRPSDFTFIYDSTIDMPPFRASSDYPSAASFHPYNMIPDSILRVQCIFVDQCSDRTTIGYQELYNRKETLDGWARIAGLDSASRNVGSDHLRTEYYLFGNSITISEAFWNAVLRGSSKVHDESFSGFTEDVVGRIKETTDYGIFFRSRRGYLGVAKKYIELRADDQICIILGANVPFILRKVCDYYVLVGDAYVEGLMHGEGIKLMQQGEVAVETINIH